MKRISPVALAALVAILLGAPAGAQVIDDNQPGSFLIFPRFDVRGVRVTEIRVENHGFFDINVHLNVVCPGRKIIDPFCDALNVVRELTPHQTEVIDVGGLNPPCNQGFVIAYAELGGIPIAWDFLTGSYRVTQGNRVEAENAFHVQSVSGIPFTVLDVDNDGLEFGPAADATPSQDYVALPSQLLSGFRSVNFAPNVGTNLILLTVDVLAGQQNPATTVAIDFWNEAEVPFSTSHEFVCWDIARLDAIDFNFLEVNLGSRYGSMQLDVLPTCPIPGACPPLFPFDPTILGAVQEFGAGFSSARKLLHDNVPKSTVYVPR